MEAKVARAFQKNIVLKQYTGSTSGSVASTTAPTSAPTFISTTGTERKLNRHLIVPVQLLA